MHSNLRQNGDSGFMQLDLSLQPLDLLLDLPDLVGIDSLFLCSRLGIRHRCLRIEPLPVDGLFRLAACSFSSSAFLNR